MPVNKVFGKGGASPFGTRATPVSGASQYEEINGIIYPKDPVAKNVAQRELGERDPMRTVLTNIANTAPPQIQAAALDPAIRQQQMALIAQLQAQAAGQGPSLAQQQFQQASNTALQKTMGAVRAGIGSNPALAARTAALAGTNLLGNLAAESGMARLKEQQDAQAALAQQLASRQTQDIQARQQDIGLSQAQADALLKGQGVQMQAALGNLGNTQDLFNRIYGLGNQPKAGGGSPNILGQLAPIAGAVIGGMVGGPPGAAVGGAIGGAAAGGLAGAGDTPTQAQSPTSGYSSPNGGTMMSLAGRVQPESQKTSMSSPFKPTAKTVPIKLPVKK